MLDNFKQFSSLINAAIGLTTLGTIMWGMLNFVYGIKDEVALLRHDVEIMQQQVAEIRGLFIPNKGEKH